MKSKFASVTIPENISLPELILQRVHEHGSKVALTDVETGREYTFADILRLVQKLGSALNKRKFHKGDVLCLITSNCIDFPLVVMATLSIGGTITAANSDYTIGELDYQLQDSGTRYLVVDIKNAEKIKKLSNKVKANLKGIFVIGKSDGFESLTDLYGDDGSWFSYVKVNSKKDVAVLFYSSGTTGKPKGVMSTHYNLIASQLQRSGAGLSLNIGNVAGSSGPSTVIAYQPFCHVYGLSGILLNGMYHGNRVLVISKFSFKLFLEAIQKYEVTILNLVPPVAAMFAQEGGLVDMFELSSVRLVTSAAAPLSKELEAELIKRLNVDFVKQAYGLTETCGATHVSPNDGWKSSSVGVLIPNTEHKIIDTDTGTELGANLDGEICIRSPSIMKGYLNKPADTAASIDGDGWLHTGDIGHYDSDGHLYIVDRLKELIKCKGFQVAPAELEDILLTHPSIEDAVVIGIPDFDAGELPKAFVVKKVHGKDVTAQEIVKFLSDRVAPYKRLRAGVEFIDKIPRSANGKTLRRLIKEQHVKAPSKSKL